MSQEISHQQFQEAMKSKKMYKKILKKYCDTENNALSDTLKHIASLAIEHIVQVVEHAPPQTKERRVMIKDATSQLHVKLFQRWDRWDLSLQKDTTKFLLKQAWALGNARLSWEEVESELKKHYSSLCARASQEKVGMELHVNKVMQILKSSRMVVVCGIAGVGKTTLLQELDRKIRHEDKHVVAHLEVRQQNIEELQQSILFQLNRKPLIPIVRPQNAGLGRQQLEQCLYNLQERGKKHVCLIIDGVCTEEFLRDFLPSNIQELLPPSSYLIASTRDKAMAHTLFKFCFGQINNPSSLYMLLPLAFPEGEALFCAKAEGDGYLIQESQKESIVKDVVYLCGGLPLALVICGNYFSSRENRANKDFVKKQLREASNEALSRQIFANLEESIDRDHLQPFMDLALFWKDKDWKKAKLAMMEDDRRDVLNYFQEKCLVYNDNDNFLVNVPIFLEALAKRFSHEYHTRYLKDALPTGQDKDQVRGLSCNKRRINIEQLSLMKELRFLDLKNCELHLNLLQTIVPFLSSIPFQSHIFFPLLFAFLLPNIILLIYSPILVSLIILFILILTFLFLNQIYSPPRSLSPHLTFTSIIECVNAKKILRQISKLQHLKYLELSWNSSLKVLPSNFFTGLTSLIHLDISNCENLQRVPSSIGQLTNLQYLDLSSCTSLQELPDTISLLVSLETLNLSNSYGLLTLPNSIGGLRSLRSLKLCNCPTLKKLPISLFNISSLQNLDVSRNTKLQGVWHSIANLISLQYLNMSYYDKLEDLPAAIGNLKSLRVLNLSNCKRLRRVPETLGKLNSLQELYLSSCDELENLPMDSIESLPLLEKLSIPFRYKDVVPHALQDKIVALQN